MDELKEAVLHGKVEYAMDITDFFVNAKTKGVWNISQFKELILLMKAIFPSLTFDWDEGAGEEWLRIYHNEYGVVAMMHTKIKIIFTRIFDFSQFNSYLDIIKFNNFNTAYYRINLDVMNLKCPELYWHSDVIKSDKFSLQDLYFATV